MSAVPCQHDLCIAPHEQPRQAEEKRASNSRAARRFGPIRVATSAIAVRARFIDQPGEMCSVRAGFAEADTGAGLTVLGSMVCDASWCVATAHGFARQTLTRRHRAGMEDPLLSPLPLGVKVQWKTQNFHGEDDSKRQLQRMLGDNDPRRNFLDRDRPRLIELAMTATMGDTPWCVTSRNYNSRRAALAHFRAFAKESVADGQCNGTRHWHASAAIDSSHRFHLNFLRKLRCARFVAAPSGWAPDTHRFYEALTMGAIPIGVLGGGGVLCVGRSKPVDDSARLCTFATVVGESARRHRQELE
jgi:hypothetical protein